MARIPILSLPVATALDGTEYLPLVQGGTTKRAQTGLLRGQQGEPGEPGDSGTGFVANAVVVGSVSDALAPGDSSSNAREVNAGKINDAVAYAASNGIKRIKVSPGTFWSDPLDIGIAGPAQQSLNLRGSGGGAFENQTTNLRFAGVTTVAVNVGKGQFMQMGDLTIVGETSPSSRAALAGVGIGFNSEIHQLRGDNLRVIGFNTAYKTGYDGDVLCDSSSFFKCAAVNCSIGWHYSQTQNYINSLYDCVASGCKIPVLSDVSKAVNIYGGNFSTTDAKRNAFACAVTWGSTFTDSSQIPSDSFTNRELSVVITSPDQPMQDGAYDAFCLWSDVYGPIPLILRDWDPDTSTATLAFLAMWFIHRGASGADTVLEAEVEAATTLYACERITPFKGQCLNIDGVHIENAGSLTTLVHQISGFGGDRSCVVNRPTFNYTITQSDLAGGTEAQKAVWYSQQSFPFIESLLPDKSQIELSNISNTAGDDRVIVDIRDGNFDVDRLVIRNCDLRLNIRSPAAVPDWPALNSPQTSSMAEGVGGYDTWMFPWGGVSADIRRHYRAECYMSSRFKGHYPAPDARLRMHPADLARITASPLGTLGEYPPLMGGVMYDIDQGPYAGNAAYQAASATERIKSVHDGFSWGQPITADYSYTAGTRAVWVSADDQTFLFQGLVVQLEGENHVVTGLFPTLGFITVVRRRPGTSEVGLAGTTGDPYSDSTIAQQAFSFARISSLPPVKNATNGESGAQTAAVGDLTGAHKVNLTLTDIGANNFTTRTASQMFADIAGAYVGLTWDVAIRNTSGGIVTLIGGTGVNGGATIATIADGVTRMFAVTFPTASTCTFTDLGVLS